MKNIKLIPTLITIPAVILLLYLSYWQFQRLAWKEDLIAKINQQIQLPVIELPNNLNIDDMLYHKVRLNGSFLHEYEVHVYAGNTKLKGGNGYYILTPLVLEDNRIVIVNRGWVSENLKNSDTRPETLITDKSEIIGAIMKTEEKGLYTHDNQAKRNIWFYINLPEIATHTNLAIEPFYILAQEEESSVLKGQNIKPNLLNNHLGYALTWLSAAISLVVIYILYHRKK
jgi:surfeit locus 1 family protein